MVSAPPSYSSAKPHCIVFLSLLINRQGSRNFLPKFITIASKEAIDEPRDAFEKCNWQGTDNMAGPKKRKSVAPNGEPPVKKHKPQQSSAKAPTRKRKVAADALRWREAQLPDMFNDAEGFFGLEEVDDVEVIRNDDNTIEFVRGTLCPCMILGFADASAESSCVVWR